MVVNVHDFMNTEGNTYAIVNAIAKSWDVLGRHERPMVSVSGGSDSDVVVDMISKLDDTGKVRYGWFNTGVELQASKNHLRYLEQRYGIEIISLPIVHPIAYTVKNYGYPFLSKYVSYAISSLQRHGYDFRPDSTIEQDMKEFSGCKDGLNWWYSTHKNVKWNVSHYKNLRDFLSLYPPKFMISDKCCYYSKKLPAERLQRSGDIDLSIVGLRRAEGGIRSVLKNCYMYSDRLGARFLPILHFGANDKKQYERLYGLQRSEAYTKYGFSRTGCVGCPFAPSLFQDLAVLNQYEPGMVNAAHRIFAPSYEYTRLYMQFCEAHYILTGREKERYRLFRR